MKVTYLKLVNVAGLMVGSNRSEIEIDFSKSKNKIVAIQGDNGVGKSVLMSAISPFSGVTSVDDRSSLSFIINGKDGYKEIHYENNFHKFIIKHYYKANKGTHSVKSYFIMDDEELNKTGNVRSFESLVEMHLGLTQEMMRLVRLGSNVNSFISLTPAKRKEYIGKLIEDINIFMLIYKGVNEDIRTVKALMATNNANLYNCHISDILVEEDNLKSMEKEIKKLEKDKDETIRKIGKIQSLMSMNDIDDLKRRQSEARSSLSEFERVERQIKELDLENVSVDKLIQKRADLQEEMISVQSKINSYRLSIDSTLANIERLELNVKKITSSNDVQSLVTLVKSLKDGIDHTSDIVKNFNPNGSTSSDINSVISKLSSFNQISQMIYTFGNKPMEVYMRLKNEGKSVDKFLKEQMKRSLSRINESDIKVLFDRVFGDEMIITPNCDTEYAECPYYRLHSVITEIHDKLEEESFDDETLRYIQVISNNIDNILNEIDRMKRIYIPDAYRDAMKEKQILERMKSKLPFFDLSDLQDYLSILTEYEIYKENLSKLQQYEYQLTVYKKSGVDGQLEEIQKLQESVAFYRRNIETLSNDIGNINQRLSEIDSRIAIVTKFNDSKKYKKMMESTLESTTKMLAPLESASKEKSELEFQLRQITNAINISRENHKRLELRINEYHKLVKEGKRLSDEFSDLHILLESSSTKEGMPVKYISKYLGRIRKLANNLLKLIYDDDFKLAKFHVDPDTFEVPYIKNGRKISDIKYSSQSELALSTMALSFALANNASNIYNILLLDEIDGGLDDKNRSAFLKMLYMQMDALNAEQVFVISHNMTQMVNIPMDVIRMSEVPVTSKLQNVIFDAAA